MSNRTRSLLSLLLGAVVAGAALLAARTPARAGPLPGTSGIALSDEGHLLGARARASLDWLLRAKAEESGSPLSILLLPHLARHEAIDELARRTFATEGLDAPGPPRVLLVVAVRDRAAAIETGQGPAGIVPEIDARRIIRRLESGLEGHHLAGTLDEAVVAIAASARATADRRRPLPPDPLEALPPPSQVAPVDVMEPGSADVKNKPVPTPEPAPEAAVKGGGLLVPTAALVSAAVVIGLALRRRRRFAEERALPTMGQPPERKAAARVKSIGDRPPS